MKTKIMIVLLSLLWSMVFTANADQPVTFQSDKLTAISHKLLLDDGRVIVAEQEGDALHIICYDRGAQPIWSMNYTDDFVKHTGGLYWIDSLEKIALMLKKEENLWELSLINDEENTYSLTEQIQSIQVPIILKGGIFYISRENEQNTLKRLGWDGQVFDLSINGRRDASVVWWGESKDVDGGYILVLSFDDEKGVRTKSLCVFNDQNQQLWTHSFEGDCISTHVSDAFVDKNGGLLVWTMKSEDGKWYPHIMNAAISGEVLWEAKIQSQHPDLSSSFITQRAEGGYTIWGTTGTTDLVFKIDISPEGNGLSYEYRHAYNLIRYINHDIYAQISSGFGQSISFVPVHELPVARIDAPVTWSRID